MSEQEVFDTLKYRIEVDKRGTRRYFNNADEMHRTDGPAVVHSNGRKEWYINGQRHRIDGPAIELVDGSRYWYQNGLLHRTDGPAIEYPNGFRAWWISDKRMSEAEFLAATQPVVEMTVADVDRLVDNRA